MKFLRLIFIATLSCLLVVSQLIFEATIQTAIAAPHPFFNPVLGNISSAIPSGMTMRLPSSFINASDNFSGAYRPRILTGTDSDNFSIVFAYAANCPQEFTYEFNGVCDDGGRIFASRNSYGQGWLREARDGGKRVTLANGIDGYYYQVTGAARGAMQTLIWEQDGIVYGLISRILSESDTIRVATSMATGEIFSPIFSAGGANCPSTINATEARLRGDQNVGFNTSIVDISQSYSNYPPDRSFGLSFKTKSARGNDIIASPRMMGEISQNIINNCSNVGSIGFYFNHPNLDKSAIYRLIDGQIPAS